MRPPQHFLVAALSGAALCAPASGIVNAQGRRPAIQIPIPKVPPGWEHAAVPVSATIQVADAAQFEAAFAHAAANIQVVIELMNDIDLATPTPRTSSMSATLLGKLDGKGYRLLWTKDPAKLTDPVLIP